MKKMKFVFLFLFVMLIGSASLQAALTYSPPSPRTGETVTFTLTPSGSPAGSISWNFGDGSPVQTGTNLTITHVYDAVGSYTATASYFTMNAARTDQATVVVTNPRQISFSPSQPKAGQSIAFTAHNFFSSCIRWDFGDGTVKNGATSENHTYANAGKYTVQAYENCGSKYGTAVTVTVAVTKPRQISFSPSQPKAGQSIAFIAHNFFSSCIRWDFGDGTVKNGATSENHTYANAGKYTVWAYEECGRTYGISVIVTVAVTNPRQISFSPSQPKAGQSIVFTAHNFFSSCIRWDFGDGTVKNGATSENHTYANAGSYTVRAYEDCGNAYGAAVTVKVAQQDKEPPPTTPSLAVTFINLYFTGSKADVSVAKDFAPLQAYADIQVTGTGILQWQWLVDGMVVKADTLAVSFGDKFTLDSGKVPGLPTAIPGRHLVTLRFQQPAMGMSFAIPTITYFVALRGPAPIIRKITPATLAPGAEYKLDLEGTDLTSGTEISFPASLAVVKKANILSPTHAQVIVFVGPTTAPGTKTVTARNEYGQSNGPGQVTIASPPEPLPGPIRPTPQPKPLTCADIAVTGIKATLVSTQLGEPTVEFPNDTVRLEITIENVGSKAVPSDFMMDLFVRRNGEKVFGRGYPIWSTTLGAPGSRFVISDITDSFPHGLKTTYSVEILPLVSECSTANNQASLDIDETQLHPGGTPDLTLSIFMVEKRWHQEGDQFKGTCYFSADVTNIGSGYCGDGSRTVDLEFIRVEGNRILAYIRIPENELPGPGSKKRFSVEVPDSQEPPGVTPVVAYINPAHNETNKANNWATNGATLNNDLESPIKSMARISFPPWGMTGRILYVRTEIHNLTQQPLQNLRLILLKNGEQIKEWKSVALAGGGSSGSHYHYVDDRPLLEDSSGADEFKVILTTNNESGLPPDNTIMDSKIRPLKWMDMDNSIVQALLQDPNDGIGAKLEKEDKNIRIYSKKTKTKISPESFYIYIEGKKKKWGTWHEFQASIWLKVHARNGQIAADVIDKKLTLGSEAEKILIAIFLPGIGYGIQHGIEKAFMSAIPNNLGIGGLPVSPCGIVLREGALYLYYPYSN